MLVKNEMALKIAPSSSSKFQYANENAALNINYLQIHFTHDILRYLPTFTYLQQF